MLRQSSQKSIKMVYCDKFSLSRGRKVKLLCGRSCCCWEEVEYKIEDNFFKRGDREINFVMGREEQVLLWHIK